MSWLKWPCRDTRNRSCRQRKVLYKTHKLNFCSIFFQNLFAKMHKRWAGRLKMWEIFTICTPRAEHQCNSEDITLYLCTFSRTALNWWRQVATCVFICWDKFIHSLYTEVGKRDKNMENGSNSEGVVCIVEHHDVLIVVIISVHWIVYLISLDFKLKIQGDSDATVVLEGLWAPSRHHLQNENPSYVAVNRFCLLARRNFSLSHSSNQNSFNAGRLMGFLTLNAVPSSTFLKTCAFLGRFSRRTMLKVAEIWCHDSFGGRVVSSLLCSQHCLQHIQQKAQLSRQWCGVTWCVCIKLLAS